MNKQTNVLTFPLVAIDPGGKHIGWAIVAPTRGIFDNGVLEVDNYWTEVVNRITQIVLSGATIVIEDYRVFPKVPHDYSRVVPVRVIGYIEGVCARHSLPLYYQQSAGIKRLRVPEWLQRFPSHNTHAVDAAKHLFIFLQRRGIYGSIV